MNGTALPIQILLASLALTLASCGPGSNFKSAALDRENFAAPQQAPQPPISPRKKRGSLLYAVGSLALYVFTYPGGKFVAKVNGEGGFGVCADHIGNVFVTEENQIQEYAHGGTAPIETLADPGYLAFACSVDASTGDLAVMNDTGNSGNVAIYPGARGTPQFYTDPKITYYYWCGYDPDGTLFIDGGTSIEAFVFAELAVGSQSFIDISGIDRVFTGPVQWDGRYITISNKGSGGGRTKIYRLRVSGSTASIAGTTRLAAWHPHMLAQSWIQGSTFTAPTGVYSRDIGIWAYPQGGKTIRVFNGSSGNDRLHAVAVSVAANTK